MKLRPIRSVFVPFECPPNGQEIKRDDLPRFERTEDIKAYIASHPELGRWRIQWQERTEKDLIEEYKRGVGAKTFPPT